MTKRLAQLMAKLAKRGESSLKQMGTVGRQLPDGTWQTGSEDGDRPGFITVLVEQGGSGNFIEALNMGVSEYPNTPVQIVYDENGTALAYARPLDAQQFLGAAAAGAVGFVPPHSHEIGTGNTDIVSGRRIKEGLIHVTIPTASLSIEIERFAYKYGGNNIVYPGGTFDLTSNLPATTGVWAWCIVGLAPATGAIEAVTGPDYYTFESLDETLITEISFPGRIVLGAVRLYEADTAISEEKRFASHPDMRNFVGSSEALSASSLDGLSDVTIASAARGDILRRDASDWDNVNIAEQRIVGRITGGDVTGLTAAQVKTLLDGVLGRTLFDHYADSSVGGAEADIFSNTLAAGLLAANGDKVIASYGGNFVTLGTETVQIKAYFAGTAIWDSTGIAVTTGTTSWGVRVEIIRVSSSVVRYNVRLTTTGASGFVYNTVGELTGLTLANTAVLKITGTSSGVGSGAGDIVGKMGYGQWLPAA